METNELNVVQPKNEIIRAIVRGTYDIQKLRIQMGNRIVANFKYKLGYVSNGMTEDQLQKQAKQILDLLRIDYKCITNGVITEGDELMANKLPKEKNFKPGKIIDNFSELVLFSAYVNLMVHEKENFNNLEKILKGIPIYDTFLTHVDGLGKQMAGVIISEIDIYKTNYVSSLWKRAGLDVVEVGEYIDDTGKPKTVPIYKLQDQLIDNPDGPIYWQNKLVTIKKVGRSRQEGCLVLRKYTNRAGVEEEKKSITFNPLLKTKLVGVLAGSFLKTSKTFVNGQLTTVDERESMAVKLGFEVDTKSKLVVTHQVNAYLRDNGYDVTVVRGKYGKIYDEYKARIRQMPAHKDKSDNHTNNMALRYCVKRFLADLYVAWRTLEGLPVMPEYSVAKLGLEHGITTHEKQKFYEDRGWKPQDPLDGQ